MRSNAFAPSAILAAAVLAVSGLSAPVALAQNGEAGQNELTNDELLRDYIHFVKINRDEAADVYARTILARGLTPPEFVDLVEGSGELNRFEEAVGLAARNPDLEESAGGLSKLYEVGKLQRARDPEQISEAIRMLEGGARSRLIAKERLVAAGEYAMPQLLEQLLTAQPALAAEVQRIMIDLGAQAVTPLSVAVSGLPATEQERVINILGLIESNIALPAIREAAEASSNSAVQRAATQAYTRLGVSTANGSAADWWLELAEAYYDERPDVTSFPGEDNQLLWGFDPALGLVMAAVNTSVYHEAMAMRAAEHALKLDPTSEATAVWVAANFSREIDTPEGYENPAYGSDRRAAMYYAVAAGTGVGQRVLARGIDTTDTPLARRAISSIERTAGGESLWNGPAGRRPLVEALSYPNRRVQIEAALAFGSAQPGQAFERSERVVPTLAGAIRNASDRYAAVISDDVESYQSVRTLLEAQGFGVLPRAGSLRELSPALAQTAAVDLVVSVLQGDATRVLVTESRANAKLSATPILSLLSGRDYTELRRVYTRDSLIAIRPSGVSDAQLGVAINELLEVASGGPVTEAEAADYSGRALNVLRDLAIARNTVFDVGDAALTLISAMGESEGGKVLRIGDILARIDQQRAQVALMDAALASDGGERIALLGLTADSAKRYGNRLDAAQIQTLTGLARSEDSELATAAAALMGSLGLPNTELVPLILNEG